MALKSQKKLITRLKVVRNCKCKNKCKKLKVGQLSCKSLKMFLLRNKYVKHKV